MKILIVGEAGCEFERIKTAISQSELEGTLAPKFFDVAFQLGTPTELCHKIRLEVLEFGLKFYATGLIQILEEWRSREGENAKLSTLLQILGKVGLSEFAESLRYFIRRQRPLPKIYGSAGKEDDYSEEISALFRR